MRLLLDEHIGPAVAAALRARGHDAVSVREAGLLRQTDDEVLTWASAHGRAVVTADFRDYHALHEAYLGGGAAHGGIVHVPRRFSLAAKGFGRMIEALDALFRAHPDEEALASVEAWLDG